MVFQPLSDSRHFSGPLSDGDIDTDDVRVFLVDQRVDAERRLACRAVTDHKLALAPADRHHSVHDLDTELDWLVYRFPGDNAGGDLLNRKRLGRVDRALAVQRPAERVNNPALHRLSNGHFDNPACAADLVAFLDLQEVTQDHGADRVFFEVERQPEHVSRELENLVQAYAGEAVDPCHAVCGFDDGADIDHRKLAAELLDLPLDDRSYVLASNRHRTPSFPLVAIPVPGLPPASA